MPRVRPPPHRAAYWWNEGVADLRRIAICLRRQAARHRRRGETAEMANVWEEYRATRVLLRKAIRDAKTRAREELLQTLKEDPYGGARTSSY